MRLDTNDTNHHVATCSVDRTQCCGLAYDDNNHNSSHRCHNYEASRISYPSRKQLQRDSTPQYQHTS